VAEQFAEQDRAALARAAGRAPPWPGKAAPPPAVSPPRPRRPPWRRTETVAAETSRRDAAVAPPWSTPA
jgi:hypothetical protein